MKEQKPHPDFENNPAHQWLGGSLASLLPALTAQLREQGGGAWRVLRNGALVSLTRGANGGRIVRIRRRHRPVSEKGEAKWVAECDVFARHMKLTDWTRERESSNTGIGELFYERPE